MTLSHADVAATFDEHSDPLAMLAFIRLITPCLKAVAALSQERDSANVRPLWVRTEEFPCSSIFATADERQADPARLKPLEEGKAIGSADPDRKSSSVDATARLIEQAEEWQEFSDTRRRGTLLLSHEEAAIYGRCAADLLSSIDAVQVRVHQIEQERDDQARMHSAELIRLQIAEARVSHLERENEELRAVVATQEIRELLRARDLQSHGGGLDLRASNGKAASDE